MLINARKKKKKQRLKADSIEEESVDEIWEQIVKAITTAANEYILSTKIQNTKSQIRKEAPKSLLYSRAKVLRKIYRKGMNSLENSIDEIKELLYNTQIKQLNYEYNTQIPELVDKWEKEWCIEIKEW